MSKILCKFHAHEGDVADAEWRGFHRIEKALWVDNTTDGMTEYADRLLSDVKALRALMETVEVFWAGANRWCSLDGWGKLYGCQADSDSR
ncbi:imelysin family protein [Paenibacillus lignilyticus]|uniref:Imelysin-like domain-containing protein n=1 Tax=Paenibacillus lignilyticus TaxID=1172615 RepID=A0ABS5CC39_9BACL|nr:hypothetical protein [Paenibacillus lignilyticus]MBP3963557.1 hypothetical protein [Paenibacillus lignilyticus]